MNIGQFVAEVREAGITLFVRDGKLRSRAEKGALTPDIEQRIRTHKDALIAWLGDASLAEAGADTIPVAPRDAPLPLSFAQQRLWFFEQMEGGSAAYNVALALRISGELDTDAVRRAFQTIVDRHESLRTGFAQIEGQPVQVPHASLVLDIPLHDLSALPPEAREQAMVERCRRERLAPFDLACAPLMRVTLIRMAPTEHVLALTLHHIVSDGWSQAVLTREFISLYAAYSAGEMPELAQLPIQYADYAHWQRQPEQAERIQRQIDYWKQTLAALPPVLDLPTDRPRGAQQSYRGGTRTFRVDAVVAQQFMALCRGRGATLFMGLLSIFDILLYRYSGCTDIAIGTPVAGRRHQVLEGMIGAFSNTVVVRSDISGTQSFLAHLDRVRSACLQAYENQDVPFEQLVEALHPERSLSHAPLVQVKLVLENAPSGGSADLHGLRFEAVQIENPFSKFDLLLSVTPVASGLACHLEYARDLFDDATGALIAEHFQSLLGAAIEAPERPVAALQMLDTDEYAQVIDGWNPSADTQAVSSEAPCVHALVEAHARRHPGRTALVCEGERLEYAEFNRRANRLAHWLRAQGIGAGAHVGLCLERGFELPIAILAVAKAGAAYVPIDPAFPDDHIQFLIEDAAIAKVLTHSSLRGRLPATASVACLDQIAAECAQQDATDLGLRVPADALIYIIYTSGSTGRPKGVCISHRALCNYIHGMLARLTLSADAQFATLATIAADLGNTAIFGALGGGYALRLLPQAASMDGLVLAQSLAAEPVDCLKIVPSHLAGLLAHGDAAALLPRQALIFGGEALKRELVETVRAHVPSCRIHNHYGPTETTVGTVMMEIFPGDSHNDGVPIGRPLANTRAYVLDPHLNPLPPGIPGELYIGGAGVAQGYWRRADLTSEKFLPDPFSLYCGARMYATGDKVRWRADGTLTFLGRTDHQLNIRGFRVEPQSVRAVVLQHPQVKDAVVVAQTDPRGETCMAAYVVARTPDAIDSDTLFAHLRARLPDYMTPAGIVFLDDLPVTLNGKLDLQALPSLQFAVHDEGGDDLMQTPTEHEVSACWCAVLGIETVGRSDNFFAIGGHSLLAMLVIARLRQQCGVELTVQQMFEAPTIKGLAACIDILRNATATGQQADAMLMRIGRRNAAVPCPLSTSQQRLWFLSQLEGPSNTYNMPVALRIRGALDTGALIGSLCDIVRRHEVLRTCYRATDGGVEQQTMAVEGFSVAIARTALLADAPELLAQVEEVARAPFDLSCDYMLRAKLWATGDGGHADGYEHVLSVTLHHIACDGWSLSILVDELTALYAARVRGETAALPELSLQYSDYAAWQRDWLEGGALLQQLDYWRERLAGAPELLELPYERSRSPEQDFRGEECPFTLQPSTVDALNRIALQHGATLYMVLLAAFKVLLARYSGSADILVGSPSAGRTTPELERLIGFFVNTLVLRTRIEPDASFGEVLAAVKRSALDAFQHQDVPYDQLVESLRPTRSLAYAPLVQTMFSLQKLPDRVLDLAGVSLAPLAVRNTVAKFDISLILTETDEGLQGALEYSTALFSAPRIQRMLGHYRCMLERIAAHSDLPLRLLQATAPAESDGMDRRNRGAHADYPYAPVHVKVRAQAMRTPEAVAVIGPSSQLTYAALETRAEHLAQRLRKTFALSDSTEGPLRVALCVERDIDLPVGMLAILKAGAVYVPLDPSYPRERLAYLVADARPAGIVTGPGLRDMFDGLPTLCIEEACSDLPDQAVPVTEDDAQAPERAAYIIYTSGSTGVPKGVLVPHRALANLSHATQARLNLGPGDRVLQFAAPGFDVSLWETFMALCWGATLYLAPKDQILPGRDLHAYLQRHRITCLALTASSLAATPCDGLPDLRTVISGGEVCPGELVRRWQPGRAFHNVYGPTEAGICASMGLCAVDADEPDIGDVFANVEAYVLDARLERMPVGVWGELHLGGAGLAHGYWGRPDLTAAGFVPDPYSGRPGARLYRTGDRVRIGDDGRIEYHSRVDDQVKLRGFRIELGEIESQLLRHPAVAETAAAVHRPAQGPEQLVAYLVPAADTPTEDRVGLSRFLASRLPAYMVPAAFVTLARMPRTGNGKIDRAALPAPSAAELVSAGDYVAPRTPTEIWLAALWCRVLGLERVGVQDDFFLLGGHSLLATQVVSRVGMEQAVDVPVRALFASPTLEKFAEIIDAGRDGAHDEEARLIAELEAMSEEEAMALIGQDILDLTMLEDAIGGERSVSVQALGP